MGNRTPCCCRAKSETSDAFYLTHVERQQLLQGSGRGRQAALSPDSASDYAFQVRQVIPGTVLLLSGCKDEQTSADVANVASFGLPVDAGPGGAGGACTNSIIKAFDEKSDHSWISLLERMRTILKQKRYTQIPQLSSSHEKDMKDMFSVCNKNPSGRYKALMIGINYAGSSSALKGCHNDVETMRRFLGTQGYTEDCIRIMLDDGKSEQPTRANILTAMSWLVEGAASGDSLFLHYSGHGTQTKDKTGTEKDGLCEAICPVDFSKEGLILDKELFLTLVAPLPEDVQMVAVMDCCHSCGVMDLPYTFKTTADALQEARVNSKMKKNKKFNIATAVKLVKGLASLIDKFNDQASASSKGTSGGISKNQTVARNQGTSGSAGAHLDGRTAGTSASLGQKSDTRINSSAPFAGLRPTIVPSGFLVPTGQARFSAPGHTTGGSGSGSGGSGGGSGHGASAPTVPSRFSAQTGQTRFNTPGLFTPGGSGGGGGHKTSRPASKPSGGGGAGGGASRSTGRRR